ncbi:MAG: ABC transporter permease, partial [Pseudothermotoga sp.]
MRKLYVAIAILGIHLIIAAFADFIAPYDPSEIVNLPYQRPSKEHLLGTDRLGRDILSQLLHGSRLSIFIGVSVGALMTLFSTTIGMLAGYYGGVVDRVLSTLTDVFLVIPGLPLMIVISAYVRVRGPLVVILV